MASEKGCSTIKRYSIKFADMKSTKFVRAFLGIYLLSLCNLAQSKENKPNIEKAKEGSEAVSVTTKPIEIKYPVEVPVALLDLATGGSLPSKLTAVDGQQLLLTPVSGSPVTIETSAIIDWSVGDNSEAKFSGTKAMSAGLGFALGALLVPSPATPLLLLMAPFMGMAQGNQFVPDFRIGIREIGVDGREQLVLIQAFNGKDAQQVRAVVEVSTGLKAGQRRSEAELSAVRPIRLKALEEQLLLAKIPLKTTNKKQPWCSVLDLSGKTAPADKYNSLLISINNLRKTLNQEPYVETAASSELLWIKYLEDENLNQWAKSNPKLALNRQKCIVSR